MARKLLGLLLVILVAAGVGFYFGYQLGTEDALVASSQPSADADNDRENSSTKTMIVGRWEQTGGSGIFPSLHWSEATREVLEFFRDGTLEFSSVTSEKNIAFDYRFPNDTHVRIEHPMASKVCEANVSGDRLTMECSSDSKATYNRLD